MPLLVDDEINQGAADGLRRFMFSAKTHQGFIMPIPPRHAGKARRSRSSSLRALRPSRAGSNLVRTTSSTGSSSDETLDNE